MGGRAASAKRKYKGKGFTPATLDYHYRMHALIRKDVNASSPRQYEKMATKFRDRRVTKKSGIEQFIRENGDILKYNTKTNEFIIIKKSGEIRTYYNPTPKIEYWDRQKALYDVKENK